MVLDILYIIIGVILVLRGADKLTEGASALARRMNVPEIVIGLTIVAAGTSAPELFVSLVSALNGTPDLAVGNIVGSNILNTMLIVGCSAMVAPMAISKNTVRKDIPFAVAASALLIILCLDGFDAPTVQGNTISRLDGAILLAGFAAFTAYTLRMAKNGTPPGPQPQAGTVKAWKSLLAVVVGLAFLIIGSDIFVDSATDVAHTLGISESVIGLTIVAGGTSLPELATSIVAARKGQSAIAIGNVIGSNVFNILATLGITAAVCPMQISGITLTDMAVMLVSMAAVWLFSFTKYTVARWEGAVLTAGYIAYIGWLLGNL